MFESVSTVAVDLDDVLFDFLGYFFQWHNIQYGTTLKPTDMVYSTIWEAWDGTKDEAAERVPAFFHEIDMLSLLPIDGAIQALTQMKERFSLSIVSARDPSTLDITQAWIHKYFGNLFDNVMLGIGNPMADVHVNTKADACRQLGADLLIDDQTRHAKDVALSGVPVILFGNTPANQADALPSNITRVEDWNHVLNVLGLKHH